MKKNIIFAVGPNGEFGTTFELRKHLVAQTTTPEELRNLPTHGLPWRCPADLNFFSKITQGPHEDNIEYARYFDVNDVNKFLFSEVYAVDGLPGHNIPVNAVLMGRTSFDMVDTVLASSRRYILPVSRSMFGAEGLTDASILQTMGDRNADNVTLWVAGGKQVLEAAFRKIESGDLSIDNIFISGIKNVVTSDILLEMDLINSVLLNKYVYNKGITSRDDTVSISRYTRK